MPPPPKPVRTNPETWEHFKLHTRVRDALTAIPGYFRTDTTIEGVKATDIHTLASALGATIEDQVVATLNKMREAWDPDSKYPLYRFIRQSQTFPDVVLCRTDPTTGAPTDKLLGIELKGALGKLRTRELISGARGAELKASDALFDLSLENRG